MDNTGRNSKFPNSDYRLVRAEVTSQIALLKQNEILIKS